MKRFGLLALSAALLLRAQDGQDAQERARDAQEKSRDAQEKARDAQERAREDLERARETAERDREAAERLRDLYQSGTEALEERKYERALQEFQQVIDQRAARADGALYWKAYTLNKLGRRDDAVAALAELKKKYASSRWLNDGKALEAEVRQASGQRVSPELEGDEELKLYAINSLMNSEPSRAVPLLEKLLNEPKSSPKLKERALFVLAQSHSEQARAVVARFAKGNANPDLQMKAVEYLGVFGSKESRQLLSEIYTASNDPAVKRSVLRGYMISHDTEKLLNLAKSEPNAELRGEAIQWLGVTGGKAELVQLFGVEQSPEIRKRILNAIFISGDTDRLIQIAKSEKDPQVRKEAIHWMGVSPREKTGDALGAMYSTETDKANKSQILHALFIQGNAKQVVEIARKEPDPNLKRDAVHWLSLMKSKESTDYMMELLNK